ncbi:MAG: macro domain-containing protein [Planctomycetes bacterium]|nr:macro domain-containing protein [Planctomycetota bacterium]MCB9885435.1 macro domain-containing protein [Planctomycetota bacterium]
MIHELSGDLLLSRADLIVHGVAPHDDFKHGLALALREKFPAMYKDFRHFCHQQNPKPGTAWLWAGVDHRGEAVRIAALFTQEPPDHPGGRPGKAQTGYVNQALHTLRKLITDEKVTSVALPRLATGVGGLDWQHVEPLVRAQLGSLDVPICVYTEFKPGFGATEPLAATAP